MQVLSLFDGMGCGREALKRVGLPVNRYFASEIDKYAIQVCRQNHPDVEHVGDVTAWRTWDLDWGKIDLVIAGSPCQGFSLAGKQLAFDDPRSKLFFEFVDIIKHIRQFNPNVHFMLENVKMKKEFLQIITDMLGVEPILINSALVSAQNRWRYYWCSWNTSQPSDRGIMLKDIVHEYFDRETELMKDKSRTLRVKGDGSKPFSRHEWDMVYDKNKISTFNVHPSGRGMNGNVYPSDDPKAPTLTTNKGEGHKMPFGLQQYIVPFDKTLQILDKEVERGKVGFFRKDSQANRVYYIHDKAVTLCDDAGGGAAKMGQYLFGCLTPNRVNQHQNGQRFSEGKKFYTLTAQDQHGVLMEGYIRKLTPVECERLQTLPDDYTEGVSNSQRYKMLGNGWTVEVIAHLFSSYPRTESVSLGEYLLGVLRV